jgi:poly(hydroxyalkanoate) depolymerase family esterase
MSRLQIGFRSALPARANWLFVAPVAICAGLLANAPASAASLVGPVSGWEQGIEPSWVSMYEYVPDTLVPNAPILLVVHFCGGNAGAVFKQARDGGMVAAADEHGFIMVLPQTSRSCWDVATEMALTNGGGGDTGAMVHQVQHVIATYNANPDRVYVTGTSSGAMATQALLAAYPDVFKGGAAFAGVPAGCWSVNNPDGQWSSPCAGGEITHTAQQWGDMVREMYPGYSGFRPRIQLWHGEADSTLSYTNQTESIKQWTNVLGVGLNPTSSTPVMIGDGAYVREQWEDSCGNTVLDAWTELAGQHGTGANMTAANTIPFLALDQSDAVVDPQVASGCVPDGSAAAGAGGANDESAAAASPRTLGGSAAAEPSRPTMACELVRSPHRAGVLAWLGPFAFVLLFGRRRQRRPFRAEAP